MIGSILHRRSGPSWRPPAIRLGAVILVLVVIEILSTALFLVVDGSWFSWRRLAEDRARVAGAPEAFTDVGRAPIEAPFWIGSLTVHPFLGFVNDPDASDTRKTMERFSLTIDELGFYQHSRFSGDPPGDAFVVAVFGGSVAQMFAIRGELLAAELESRPELGGRPVRVVCRAVQGHKQPQQLMALSWALAVGDRIDAVVLLDGFNDVVLPLAENLRQRVSPYYPRSWRFLTSSVSDPAVLRLIGEAVTVESRRRGRAERFSAPLVRTSVTANLLWRLLDRRDANHLGELRTAVTETDVGERRFATHGADWVDGVDPEVVAPSLAAFWARCSRQMRDLCEGAGLPFVHVLQPNQYVPNSKPMTPAERRVAIDPEHPYRAGVLTGYPHLDREGRNLAADGVRFVDATMAFREVEAPLYFDACCHFNRDGDAILAAMIADELVPALGLTAPPR